jgi:hypothetical protein
MESVNNLAFLVQFVKYMRQKLKNFIRIGSLHWPMVFASKVRIK